MVGRPFAKTIRLLARAEIASCMLLLGLACSITAASAAQSTQPKVAVESSARLSSQVKDQAGVFGGAAIAAAREDLKRIERDTGVATIIETTPTLAGEPIDRVTMRRARESGIEGIFALIARKEHAIEVLASRAYQTALSRDRLHKIREAFINSFHRRDFDDGLKRGVAAIEQELALAAKAGDLPRTVTAARGLVSAGARNAPSSSGDGDLVVRDQVRLRIAGARAIVSAATAQARSMALKVNVAVVDEGGHLLAFERMDGARPASAYTAITKATTAATMRQPTGPFPPGATNPDPLLNLSLQNAALASGGKVTTLLGGVPVVVDGQVIGGVGVGGGTGEQDAQIARAGVRALTDRLAAPSHVLTKPPLAEKPDHRE
jgi:glc operon protein GlcG